VLRRKLERRITILKLATLTAILAALSFIPMVPAGHAYGNTAIWQIGFSGNCDNPQLCGPPFGLGGFWGWVEFDQGGVGDATVAECSHLFSDTPPLSGAQSFLIEIENWYVAPGSAGPMTFFLGDGEVTIVGHTGGPPMTVPLGAVFPAPFDTGFPAVPGHYSTSEILGFSAPGVAFQYQVVQIPNR